MEHIINHQQLFKRYLEKKVVTGATAQTISPKFLRRHPIALQPIGKQRRDQKINRRYT